ncbi:hypothetical protein [Dawidia soli]|uniref:hypothetical protein n=1 Tax=Dawidia soli TaxID=2782352 RepID=UPI0020B21E83|nr:hypothetical protein [Dawidia soli]
MAIKKEELATVVLGKHTLNNTYIIYENGTYERFYDRSTYALNLTEKGIVSAFSNYLREKVLSKCQKENRMALEELFFKHPPAPEK